MLSCKLILLIVLIGSSVNQDLLSKFKQNDYKTKDFRSELASYNSEIVKYMQLKTFKYNRTTAAVNASINFLIDVENKMEMVVQAYKFASNQYRHFPMRFQLNVHKAFEANVGGTQNIKKCGNVRNAYFVKGVDYYVCNFVVDERKLPPFIPTGQYKVTSRFTYINTEVFVLNVFLEVYRPVTIPTN